MKNLKAILGAVALALISAPAFAATPTPAPTNVGSTATPVAAATAASSLRKRVETSANFLKFIASGTCTVNPAALNGSQSAVYSCNVPLALVGDFASVTKVYSGVADENPSVGRDCAYVDGAAVTAADTISFRLVNRYPGTTGAESCDPPAAVFQYLVLRPNPSAQP